MSEIKESASLGDADDIVKPQRPKTLQEMLLLQAEEAKGLAAAGEDEDNFEAATPGDAQSSVVDDGSIPEWAVLPEKLKFPPGRKVAFILIPANWTEKPELGDRQCIFWSMGSADEVTAIQRARGQGARMLPENAQQCIRAIDGKIVDWTGKPTKGERIFVPRFWEEIGYGCRQLLQQVFLKLHEVTDEQQLAFFTSCLVIRSSVA